MAANYWDSTQRANWTFSKAQLANIRSELEAKDRALVSQYPLPERRHLNIYFYHQFTKLGRRMSLRQQPLATAQVYLRRFYTKIEIRRTNPFLVMATALYLACKMEECPQHIRLVVAEARNTWPDVFLADTPKLGECEFSLIAEMNSQLIVHHPYRSLTDLQGNFSLTQDEISLAWSIINDHYLTDLPLLYPPHIIAVTAIFLSVVLKPTQSSLQVHSVGVSNALQALGNMQGIGASGAQSRVQKLVNWLAESSIDVEAIVDCTQELISLYEVWETYSEKDCKDKVHRFIKAKGLDK
ncbi:C/H/G cyclin [Patellaria atrata CBS 101060]|uniref:RNA polymerase II holoenzyme cyclin-like subunit n=1 Tax=Patellaria atrata CBS 101060 TaxID=1346257 RepID=A0A9P4SGU6_9PEZI|nr:C/H/G cyclin [Patellaria atrata CBS 101060]